MSCKNISLSQNWPDFGRGKYFPDSHSTTNQHLYSQFPSGYDTPTSYDDKVSKLQQALRNIPLLAMSWIAWILIWVIPADMGLMKTWWEWN